MDSFEQVAGAAEEYYREAILRQSPETDDKWLLRVREAQQRIFTPEGKLNRSAMEKFRGQNILLPDMDPFGPYADFPVLRIAADFVSSPLETSKELLREILNGERRGGRALLEDTLSILKQDGGLDVLRRNPIKGTPGTPYFIERDDCSFNMRWLRHVYLVNLLERNIGEDIKKKEKFTTLDLGAGYGVFSSLLKNEYPQSRHILVDFPEMLILAHYYLKHMFPEAKIGTYFHPARWNDISKESLDDYDFILVGNEGYDRLANIKVDLFTNFLSLGEMPRPVFESYISSNQFNNCTWFYTTNRFESAPRLDPTHQGDITMFDYPFDDFERIFFGVNCIHRYFAMRIKHFFYKKEMMSSPLFDFIGRRKYKPPT